MRASNGGASVEARNGCEASASRWRHHQRASYAPLEGQIAMGMISTEVFIGKLVDGIDSAGRQG